MAAIPFSLIVAHRHLAVAHKVSLPGKDGHQIKDHRGILFFLHRLSLPFKTAAAVEILFANRCKLITYSKWL